MAGPIDQFKIEPIIPMSVGDTDISFTNSSLWMIIAIVSTALLFMAGTRRKSMVPGRLQSVVEILYEFVASMVRSNVGQEGRKYFPFIFTIFMVVLMGNLLGLIPYAFTYTSHIVVTGALALFVFLTVTLIGIVRHGFHFFSFFLPEGVPILMAPMIVPVEVISYLSRPVSLSLRLFANMMAGHTMLKVFAGFSVTLGVAYGLAPLAINTALIGLELLVAVLQAYVFAILSCLYLKDALELH